MSLKKKKEQRFSTLDFDNEDKIDKMIGNMMETCKVMCTTHLASIVTIHTNLY